MADPRTEKCPGCGAGQIDTVWARDDPTRSEWACFAWRNPAEGFSASRECLRRQVVQRDEQLATATAENKRLRNLVCDLAKAHASKGYVQLDEDFAAQLAAEAGKENT